MDGESQEIYRIKRIIEQVQNDFCLDTHNDGSHCRSDFCDMCEAFELLKERINLGDDEL